MSSLRYIWLRYDIESEICGCVNTSLPRISELSSEFRLLFVRCERFQDRLSFLMSPYFSIVKRYAQGLERR